MVTRTTRTPDERAFYALSNTIMIGLMLIIIFPLLNVLAQSFSSPSSVLGGRVFIWPVEPTLFAYKNLLRSQTVFTGYINTLFYMIVGTVINVFMTVICAYPLARRDFSGRKVFMAIFSFTMLFNGGMIPTYLLVRNLGMIDTRWAMLIPGAINVWNMIMARTFFDNTIPVELYESATLDGASHFRVLISIVLPLSTPILAVLGMFYAVGHWNQYFNAMLYLSSPKLFNIQIILRGALQNITTMMDDPNYLGDIQQAMGVAEVSKYAMIVLTMVPMLIIYPFAQRFFIKGIMIGAVKG